MAIYLVKEISSRQRFLPNVRMRLIKVIIINYFDQTKKIIATKRVIIPGNMM